MPNQRTTTKLHYRRKFLKIPLEYKKKYCEILMKGFNPETMAEVRDLYKEDFPKIFPNLNFVQLHW